MSAAGPILPQVSNLVNDIRYIRAAGLRIPCDCASLVAHYVICTRLRARVSVPEMPRMPCTSGDTELLLVATVGIANRPTGAGFRTNLCQCVAGNHYPEWARESGRPGSSGVAGAGTLPRLWVTCAALARVPTLGATPVAGAALALGRDIRQRFQGHHWRGFPYPGGWSIAPVAARPPPRIIAAASSPHTHAGSPARGPRASGTIRRCSPSTRRAP